MPWNLSEKGFWQYQNKHGTYGCRDAPFRFKNRIIRGRRQRLMYKLVLLRHGESVWNKENRFTGWIDVGLSDKGVEEAVEAGRVMARAGYVFAMAYHHRRLHLMIRFIREKIHAMQIFAKRISRLPNV